MSLVLDAGTLLAIDRRDRRVGAMLRVAQRVLTTDSGDLRKLLNALAVEADLVHI